MPIFQATRRKVSKNVANNPVAQALIRQDLMNRLRDQKIAILMLTKGESCVGVLEGVEMILKSVYVACCLENKSGPRVSQLKGAVSACNQVMRSDYWDPINTTSLVNGLNLALELAGEVKGPSMATAWESVSHLTNSKTVI